MSTSDFSSEQESNQEAALSPPLRIPRLALGTGMICHGSKGRKQESHRV
jgi:hypothetical protein